MYVALVPNRNSPPACLLREGYREGGKVKTRTLANLSHWSLAKIERLRRVLRDEALPDGGEGLTMLRSLPHEHVAAALGTARKIGLDRLLATGAAPARLAALVLAMIVPGQCLRLITQHVHGSGMRHTLIFQANKTQTRNPGPSCPGQVFTLPVLESAAGKHG